MLFYFLFLFLEWLAFIGQKTPPGFPGSPYAINFKSSIPDSSEMKLMDVPAYSCGDTLLGCSCGDCPSSPVCSNLEPPTPHREDSCSIIVGPLKVWQCSNFNWFLCFDYSIALAMVMVHILSC